MQKKYKQIVVYPLKSFTGRENLARLCNYFTICGTADILYFNLNPFSSLKGVHFLLESVSSIFIFVYNIYNKISTVNKNINKFMFKGKL